MDDKNYIEVTSWNPWKKTYFIIDTADYLADRIFIEKKLPVYFGRELKRENSPYILIEVRIKKKREKDFLSCMEKLKNNMLLMGYFDYQDFCQELQTFLSENRKNCA